MSIEFKRKLTVCIGLFAFIITCWYLWEPDKTGDLEEVNDRRQVEENTTTVKAKVPVGFERQTAAHTQRVKTLNELYSSPVNFWGKVVDENGRPLAGAIVRVILYDDPMAGYTGGVDTKFEITSDDKGDFSILGKNAASISVTATLSGYKPYCDPESREKRSRVSMEYFDKCPYQLRKYSTKNEPTVLILQKKNPPSNLIHIEETRQLISRNGSSLNLLLKKKGQTIDINLRCLSSVPQPFNYEKYDWEAEVEIKGGSIQQVKDITSQMAPESGYVQSFKLKMPENAPKWSRKSPSNKQYFWIKLDGGGYVRAQIRFVTGRKHLVSVQAWINTDSNDFVIER